jgi:hypothetical protein
MSQIDIIKKTYEYFIQNDKLPIPEDIDRKCEKIKINPYFFREYCINNNYKIFFTNCIDRNFLKTKRFPAKYNLEKLNIDKYCNGIDLEKYDKNTYNEYSLKLKL